MSALSQFFKGLYVETACVLEKEIWILLVFLAFG